jgi:PAS domain S-box-containing protein
VKRMPIKWQLLLIVLVVALPAAATIVYSGVKLRNEALNEAYRDTLKLVDRIVAEQQNLVTGAEQLMAAVAQLPEVKRHEAAKVEPILRELAKLNPMYANIIISDTKGSLWATALPVKPPYIADRRYFKNALASGGLSSGEYVISRTTSKPAINFAYPFTDDHGNIAGVISVGFMIDRYRQLLQRMQFAAGTSFVLIDHRGIILSRGIDPEPFIGKEYLSEAFRQMRDGPEEGTSVRKGVAGDKRIISYRKMSLKGEQTPYMYVTAGVPVKVALERANRMLLFNATVFVSFLAGALMLAWFIGKRSIADRVTLLEQASRRLAAGNLDTAVSDLVVGGELGRLGQTFDSMARQLALREKSLRENEKFLAAIIETEPECVKLLASDGSILMMNRAGLDMIQEESFDRVKDKTLYAFIDPEYVAAFETVTKDVFNGKHGHLEFKVIGAKGRPLWLETHAVPLRNDNGEIISLLGITVNVTERKEMDRLKDEMISAVSHEMRTPLTAMLGYIEFIMENRVDDVQAREYLGIVRKETERLNELISNFLDMQRLKARQETSDYKSLEVRPLLEQAATLFAGSSNKYRITVDASAELPPVVGNEEDIRTVLNNLLSNAVKFSPNGGNIVLGARREDGNVTLWVKDEGIGIITEEQDRIFDRFYRVDNTARRTTGGTGLGLALVKKIVLAHGGRAWVESVVGKGSTFYVSLPTCLK